MKQPDEPQSGDWGAANSRAFIDFGRYFVPGRELQISLICDLIPAHEPGFTVIELCCGEGLLAEQLLEHFPGCSVDGYDGSPDMLATAAQRLARFGERFRPLQFDLAAADWRRLEPPVRAVISSLALHHLDDTGKASLFHDIYAMLEPGGALMIADLVRASDQRTATIWADAWDAAVRQRGIELDGSPDRALAAFERERWNMYRYPETEPDSIDKPSLLIDQLAWLRAAGFDAIEVYWLLAGHAIFGGVRSTDGSRRPNDE